MCARRPNIRCWEAIQCRHWERLECGSRWQPARPCCAWAQQGISCLPPDGRHKPTGAALTLPNFEVSGSCPAVVITDQTDQPPCSCLQLCVASQAPVGNHWPAHGCRRARRSPVAPPIAAAFKAAP